MNLRVLRYRTVAAGVLLAAGIASTLFGATIVLPQYSQNILGFTAFGSGELMLFRALPVMLFAPVVAGLVGAGRVDARYTMGVGFLLNAVGSYMLASVTTSNTSFQELLPGLTLGGLGTAMLFIPLLIAVQTATTAEDAPQASSFITLAFQLGGSIASAILVTLIDRRGDYHYNVLGSAITPNNLVIHSGLQNVAPGQLYGIVVQQAKRSRSPIYRTSSRLSLPSRFRSSFS